MIRTRRAKRAFRVSEAQVRAISLLLRDFRIDWSEVALKDDFIDPADMNRPRGAVLLRSLRTKARMTQWKLSAKVKASSATIAMIEQGKLPISSELAERLATEFHVRPEDFEPVDLPKKQRRYKPKRHPLAVELKAFRIKNRLRQGAVARVLGYTDSAICAFEIGRSPGSKELVAAVASLLKNGMPQPKPESPSAQSIQRPSFLFSG